MARKLRMEEITDRVRVYIMPDGTIDGLEVLNEDYRQDKRLIADIFIGDSVDNRVKISLLDRKWLAVKYMMEEGLISVRIRRETMKARVYISKNRNVIAF